MQVLLGVAQRAGSRRELLRQIRHLITGRGPYARSMEELTPVGVDWLSAVPLVMTALLLLTNPRLAHELPKRGWGAHLLDVRAVRLIEHEIR